MPHFGYAPAIFDRYPSLTAGVIFASDLRVGPAPEALNLELQAEETRIRDQFESSALSSIPSIAAWRQAYSAFGTKPSRYRSAIEALMRRIVQTGSLPRVNALVDAGNCAAVRARLPVAVFDLAAVRGDVQVRFATGEETYVGLGEAATEAPYAGEVIYADDGAQAHSRRWNWRQSELSRAGLTTSRALITTEAVHAGGRADVESALDDLSRLIAAYCGGALTAHVLDASRTSTAALS